MNSKMPALLPIISLFIVVLSSGCTSFGGQTTGSGKGIVIENFESDFQKIYAGETFKLQMKAKNTGSVDAGIVKPVLYNIDMQISGQSIAISCSSGCGSSMVMLAKDADRGTEGESKTCIWNCKAPDDIPKVSVTFNPSLRLYYLYRTTTIKSINIASQNELRTLQTQGGALPSETISTTEGPVQLDVLVNGPIRYWAGENTVTFPININLQNNGGGIACLGDCTYEKNWNKIELSFENVEGTATLKSCDLQAGKMEVDLWKGQSRTITCEVQINVGQTTGFVQKSLSFEAGYDYFVDASTSIEVVGRE
jgi:hypothetical protein